MTGLLLAVQGDYFALHSLVNCFSTELNFFFAVCVACFVLFFLQYLQDTQWVPISKTSTEVER